MNLIDLPTPLLFDTIFQFLDPIEQRNLLFVNKTIRQLAKCYQPQVRLYDFITLSQLIEYPNLSLIKVGLPELRIIMDPLRILQQISPHISYVGELNVGFPEKETNPVEYLNFIQTMIKTWECFKISITVDLIRGRSPSFIGDFIDTFTKDDDDRIMEKLELIIVIPKGFKKIVEIETQKLTIFENMTVVFIDEGNHIIKFKIREWCHPLTRIKTEKIMEVNKQKRVGRFYNIELYWQKQH